MNIILPLGGLGERFAKQGYIEPKPLINIDGIPMIKYVLSNLHTNYDDQIFIIYNKDFLQDNAFINKIHEINPKIQCIPTTPTKGAAETIYNGIKYILDNNLPHFNKTLCCDCDTFYTADIVSLFRNCPNNAVFFTVNTEPTPIYSYICMDSCNNITQIAEKRKISDNANTGAYGFNSIYELYKTCEYILQTGITFNGEPYTSCVIEAMIVQGQIFKGIELDSAHVFSLGTPEAVEIYKNRTYCFMFDLDGTIAHTDQVYYKVWKQIIPDLTDEIFNNFIKGNTDSYVNDVLCANKYNMYELMALKDSLFLQNLQQIYEVKGIVDFTKKIKNDGHHICVVTNSNRDVAINILKHLNLHDKMDFVITNNDCLKGKPDREPYEKAMNIYGCNMNRIIIFEDSKSGLLSAKQIQPVAIIGITTNYTTNELLKYGATHTIDSYEYLDHRDYIKMCSEKTNLQQCLQKHFPSSTIDIESIKMKGGFIADVVCIKIDGKSYVFKYENTEVNGLSSMAKQLDLYNREYDFYNYMSGIIPVKIPTTLGIINENNVRGIILENLHVKNLQLNWDLNQRPIEISLKIVENMANMHASLWGQPLTTMYPMLKTSMSDCFHPFLPEFVEKRKATFLQKWGNKEVFHTMFEVFPLAQQNMFKNQEHTTFIHGDIKSPNIFYSPEGEPYFIDWQHCAIGKGVQDLVFFLIESFSIESMQSLFPVACKHYLQCLQNKGIQDYNEKTMIQDMYYAVCYVPFFTAVWFGTVPTDELIDKEFPYLFIKKMEVMYNLICEKIINITIENMSCI